MATIRRRRTTPKDQCRATRRVVTILLLFLVLVFTIRIVDLMTRRTIPFFHHGRANNSLQDEKENVVVMRFHVDDDDDAVVDIRLHLYADKAPLAARYVQFLAQNASSEETCRKCTLYRGEPVPDYWGSPDYPDRYFDGGRWGPPYALVQGKLLSDHDYNNEDDEQHAQRAPPIPPAESHNPIIERGMVAWAGGKGGPHFFIALASHPEWRHGHTVWAHVVADDDMRKVGALLNRPLVSTQPKRPPIVSNFVTPIPITIRML